MNQINNNNKKIPSEDSTKNISKKKNYSIKNSNEVICNNEPNKVDIILNQIDEEEKKKINNYSLNTENFENKNYCHSFCYCW